MALSGRLFLSSLLLDGPRKGTIKTHKNINILVIATNIAQNFRKAKALPLPDYKAHDWLGFV